MPGRFLVAAFLLVASCHCSANAQSTTGRYEWPQWRGPQRDGVSRETGLLKEWPEGGPPVAWRVENVGVGYSSLAVKDGRVITQGDLDGIEHIIALSEKDGSLLWAVQPEPVKRALDERLAKEFAAADRNGDGLIDEAEALGRMGWNFNKSDQPGPGDAVQVAQQRAARLLKQLDKDGDGKISGAEAGSGLRDNFVSIDSADDGADAAKLAQQRTIALLKELDQDKDGKISRREAGNSTLNKPFRRIDERLPGKKSGDDLLTAEEIEAYLSKAEAGQDGMLSADELERYYARTFPRRRSTDPG